MNATTDGGVHSAGAAARRGAALGLRMVFGYGLAFAVYAVVRSSLQIVAILAPGENLAGTLVASGLSILLASLVTAALLAIVAVIVETVTLVVIYALCRALRLTGAPGRAALIGLTVSLVVMAAIQLPVIQSLGTYWVALWPAGYLFWLGLPALLYVVVNVWAAWRMA